MPSEKEAALLPYTFTTVPQELRIHLDAFHSQYGQNWHRSLSLDLTASVAVLKKKIPTPMSASTKSGLKQQNTYLVTFTLALVGGKRRILLPSQIPNVPLWAFGNFYSRTRRACYETVRKKQCKQATGCCCGRLLPKWGKGLRVIGQTGGFESFNVNAIEITHFISSPSPRLLRGPPRDALQSGSARSLLKKIKRLLVLFLLFLPIPLSHPPSLYLSGAGVTVRYRSRLSLFFPPAPCSDSLRASVARCEPESSGFLSWCWPAVTHFTLL